MLLMWKGHSETAATKIRIQLRFADTIIYANDHQLSQKIGIEQKLKQKLNKIKTSI